jgi:hypothetical protein
MVHPTAAARSGNGLLRVIGRVLLWACVILLLARGVAATIHTSNLQRTVTVTVTHQSAARTVSGGGR